MVGTRSDHHSDRRALEDLQRRVETSLVRPPRRFGFRADVPTECIQQILLDIRQGAWYAVQHAELSQRVACVTEEWHTDVDSLLTRPGHEWIVHETRIRECVGHDEGVLIETSMRAERDLAWGLLHLEPDACPEPLPVQMAALFNAATAHSDIVRTNGAHSAR